MDDRNDLRADLDAWFDAGDELAVSRARDSLASVMTPGLRLLRVLSRDELDEIRQDVLSRLLARDHGALKSDVTAPLGYAKRAWTHACTDALRKWGPRLAREDEVRAHIKPWVERPDEVVQRHVDTERAIAAMGALTPRQRVALLLLTRPTSITEADWSQALAEVPPPRPTIPAAPTERVGAAMILFGSAGHQLEDSRRRQTSFDKLVQRAVIALRDALGIS